MGKTLPHHDTATTFHKSRYIYIYTIYIYYVNIFFLAILFSNIKLNSKTFLKSSFVFQTFPFFGVEPTILNEHGEELEGEAEGYLVSLNSLSLTAVYMKADKLDFVCSLI